MNVELFRGIDAGAVAIMSQIVRRLSISLNRGDPTGLRCLLAAYGAKESGRDSLALMREKAALLQGWIEEELTVQVLLVLMMFAVMALPVTPASAKGRSFDECRQLAVERGVQNPKYPRRYLGLEATGAKSKPQGFMAQCMAGKLS
jgi:hypothetical protein